VADVSETLLFRYYGSKAVLFDEVVCAPFNDVMRAFLDERAKLSGDEQLKASEHHIFVAVYELFEKNQSLFTALLSARGMENEDTGPLPFDGLLSFYKEGTREQLEAYTARDERPPFDMAIGLRLAFGMLAASVLLKDWLFPDRSPSRDEVVDVLETMVSRALDPAGQR
jgi:AcrR family transcriptional regulator